MICNQRHLVNLFAVIVEINEIKLNEMQNTGTCISTITANTFTRCALMVQNGEKLTHLCSTYSTGHK